MLVALAGDVTCDGPVQTYEDCWDCGHVSVEKPDCCECKACEERRANERRYLEACMRAREARRPEQVLTIANFGPALHSVLKPMAAVEFSPNKLLDAMRKERGGN